MSRIECHARGTFAFLIIAIGFFLPCLLPSSALGGLYQCTDGSGSLIFTDRPAQLQRCSPLPTTQSSSAPAPQTSVPLPYQNALPATIDPPPAPFIAPDPAVPPAGPAVAPQPCTPGFNPLNPLSAPPCHQAAPGQSSAAPRLN
jgi:hypothetical protein